jgi:hypothetical protein
VAPHHSGSAPRLRLIHDVRVPAIIKTHGYDREKDLVVAAAVIITARPGSCIPDRM